MLTLHTIVAYGLKYTSKIFNNFKIFGMDLIKMTNCKLKDKIILPHKDYENCDELNVYECVDIKKIVTKKFGTNENNYFFKFQMSCDKDFNIWIDESALHIGRLLYNYIETPDRGVYSEELLIKMGILKNSDECRLDLNNLPPLTQKQIDDFEPERLRLEQEIREYEEQQQENFMKNNNKSKVFCFLKEKKKRCKKE